MNSPVYTVSALVRYIKSALDNDMNLQAVFIKGEISNFTNHRSGHWYFTLKDAKARISCVMFSSYAARCPIMLKEGMRVIITASVSMYEAAGSTQLYVTKVQADGIGDLYLQLEQTKAKLLKEGLFDPNHKKALPIYPMSIGIITAKTGAAVQDMLTTIARRWPLAEVQVYPTLVQGAAASAQIMKVLQTADQNGHDVLLLARGGGSLEDLWCFNEEALARMVYQIETVVVTGVGHETDTTLVDYVSDARAPTPTAAAELITPDRMEVLQNLTMMRQRMLQALRGLDQKSRQRLEFVKNNRYLKNPLVYAESQKLQLAMSIKSLSDVENRVERNRHALSLQSRKLAYRASLLMQEAGRHNERKEKQLLTSVQEKLRISHEQMAHQTALLDAFSPLKILNRGYSIVSKQSIIRSVTQLLPQDEVEIRFADGRVLAQIEKIKENDHE